jgi:hypothetical protein
MKMRFYAVTSIEQVEGGYEHWDDAIKHYNALGHGKMLISWSLTEGLRVCTIDNGGIVYGHGSEAPLPWDVVPRRDQGKLVAQIHDLIVNFIKS